MSLNATQLRELVVRPALQEASLWTQAAENLVMGTAAQESRLVYLHQVDGGPALGLWQMEPATCSDLWANYIGFRADLQTAILKTSGFPVRPPNDALVWNLRYAALMCRVHYRRFPDPLPVASDIEALGALWKARYNGPGKGTVEQFVANYQIVA